MRRLQICYQKRVFSTSFAAKLNCCHVNFLLTIGRNGVFIGPIKCDILPKRGSLFCWEQTLYIWPLIFVVFRIALQFTKSHDTHEQASWNKLFVKPRVTASNKKQPNRKTEEKFVVETTTKLS